MSLAPKKPELLAPVGSPEALIAAVRCGADAVYLGAGRFHARQHSQPFDEAALREAVGFCHARGVAVHMTLNTLVREDEMVQALADAERAASLGVDALIVQDRGLAAAIHRAAPQLTLHASTQLSCHTPAGVEKLKNDGFSRVVLAREMTEAEIAVCSKLGCETEVFVHGALCMSVSGQCLLSAMLGGRSGNRGQCAQPCRLPFCVNAKPREEDRALSLKDNSMLAHVGTLAALGVDSLKIEGRMKRPEYVAAAVSVCRAVLDGETPDAALLDDLKSVFSRSGFTDGYFTGKRSIAMFGSRTKDDVTAAPAANKRLAALYRKERAAVAVDMTLTMRENVPLTLTLRDSEGRKATAFGELPRSSETPISDERIEAALRKLGGTPYTVSAVHIERDASADAPLSALNALRREAIDVLTAQRETREAVAFIPKEAEKYSPIPAPLVPAVIVRLQNAAQWTPTLGKAVSLVTVPSDTPQEQLAEMVKAGAVAIELPRGMFGMEDVVRAELRSAKKAGVKAAVVHHVGALALAKEAGVAVIGGFGLHAVNRETLGVHMRDGLAAATLSPELAAAQCRFAQDAPLPVGVHVYGRLPLMLLRNCPAKAAKGCGGCKQDRVLTDRKGVSFPLMCSHGCADLLNSVPLYTADKPPETGLHFVTLYMTDESATHVLDIVQACKEGTPATSVCRNGFTRGMKMG